ncbi:hypothetical protein ADINL_2894 [Nitrincola lacisaponensis]|uniref:Uncharacterized protein n=1 Tax=Nitrincola lacisaponensis TaxID=267850 RepID=A0A063XY71_9GAMM|nr:hypothetical protein ADINL_2894 [Nitrincola lacisaponensis]
MVRSLHGMFYAPVQHETTGLAVQMAMTDKEGGMHESLESE